MNRQWREKNAGRATYQRDILAGAAKARRQEGLAQTAAQSAREKVARLTAEVARQEGLARTAASEAVRLEERAREYDLLPVPQSHRQALAYLCACAISGRPAVWRASAGVTEVVWGEILETVRSLGWAEVDGTVHIPEGSPLWDFDPRKQSA